MTIFKKNPYRFLLTTLSLIVLFAFSIPKTTNAQANLTPAQKAALEAQLAQVEAEQKQAEAELTSAKARSSSLSRDIAVLDAKIKAAQLDIKVKTLLIQTLGNDINAKQTHINNLEERIDRGKESLAVILRKTNEIGSATIPEVILSQTTVAGFFTDIDSFESVQEGLKSTFQMIRTDEAETAAEKDALDKRRNKELDAKYVIEQEKKNIEADEKEKQRLLGISKGNEKAYTSLVAEKAAKAAQIRATLFPLAGGGQPIPFGDAYKYAMEAQRKTGVRAAFLLAIFAQESSVDSSATFGKNVGQCYLSDPSTGAGIGANTGTPIAKVMNPTRDVPPFLEIIKALNGDPYKQRVSCPQSTGWGGAMGPAQFIASTWMLFVDRIMADLGISGMPNPWDPRTAFMASSIYLSDLGASAGGYSAERNAACKYYSGKSCSASSFATSYGNSVIAKADSIQRTMIDPLQGL